MIKRSKLILSLLASMALLCTGVCGAQSTDVVKGHQGKTINILEVEKAALEKCHDTTGVSLGKRVVNRFLTYVSFDTQSSEISNTVPSTEKQKDLGRYLVAELTSIGLQNVEMDEHGFVYATLPASSGNEDKPVLAYLCHQDVSPASPSANIHTIIDKQQGKTIIHTDRKTLLGADDKAGLAETVTALESILQDAQHQHPEIRFVATVDEEIGSGIKSINMDKLKANYAYTIDGEELGELTYETWNAARAEVNFTGVMSHPGLAYGKMKNTSLMIADFIQMLPENERPETTKDRDGFYYVDKVSSSVDNGQVTISLRDFEKAGLQARKDKVNEAVTAINEKYGSGSCAVNISDTYPNMRDYIMPDYKFLIDNVEASYAACGVKTLLVAARGGTDGSRLSAKGLPTPNLGTGGANAHGLDEYVAVEDLEKMVEVIVDLSSRF